jgi:hypothetical protein
MLKGDEVIDIAESVVLKMQRFIQFLALIALLVLQADRQV